MNELIQNIDKLHTTELGVGRIKKNLGVENDDVIQWCKDRILDGRALIERKGKNWYVLIDDQIITVNAHSFTVITAHKQK